MTFRFPTCAVVAFDIEGTGIDVSRERILQYAVYGVDAAGACICLDSVVDAGTETGRDPYGIPGVRPGAVAAATPIRDGHLDMIRAACTDAVVVMHQRHFDWPLLMNEYKRAKMDPPVPKAVRCTLWLAHKLHLPRPHRLGMLCAEHGIPHTTAHNAAHDARATFHLYVLMANRWWYRWFDRQPNEPKLWSVRSRHFPLPPPFGWASDLRCPGPSAVWVRLEQFRHHDPEPWSSAKCTLR
jgi:DNA polymerase III alpha subunit (gram-positive type)